MATKPVQKQEFVNKAERLAALRSKVAGTNKTLGIKGVQLASSLAPKDRASFGVKELDDLTGGGLVHGAFMTVWGGPGSGKTTLAYKTAAQAQKDGKIVYWIALENFDAERAAQFGVNLDELMVGQFPQAEMCLDTIIGYARDKLVDVIILDSIHSMSPKAEQENSKGEKSTADNSIGLLARKLSQFFPMAIDPIKRSNIAVMLIGQTRMSIGFISFEHLSGGNALLHNSRMTMRMRRGAADDAPKQITYEEDGDKKKKVEKVIGFNCVCKLDKVQVTGSKPEGSVSAVPYYFESGFELPQFIKDENKEIETATTDTTVSPVVEAEEKKETPASVTEPAPKVRKRGVSAKRKKA